jgi:hypothetical protein
MIVFSFGFFTTCNSSPLLQVCNKSVAEVTSAVEAKMKSAGSISKKSIFTGDIKIARSAADALKLHLTRNVELLSSMNALLFPQPGANQPMVFSRCEGLLMQPSVILLSL